MNIISKKRRHNDTTNDGYNDATYDDDIYELRQMFLLTNTNSMLQILNDMSRNHTDVFHSFTAYMKTRGCFYVQQESKKHNWQFQLTSDLFYMIANCATMKERFIQLSSVCQFWHECIYSAQSWKYVDIPNYNYRAKSFLYTFISASNMKSIHFPTNPMLNDIHPIQFDHIQELYIDYKINFLWLFTHPWKQLKQLHLEQGASMSVSDKISMEQKIQQFDPEHILFPQLELLYWSYSNRSNYLNEAFILFHLHTPILEKLRIGEIEDILTPTAFEFLFKVKELGGFMMCNDPRFLDKLFSSPTCRITEFICYNYHSINNYNLKQKASPIHLENLTIYIDQTQMYKIPATNRFESKETSVFIENDSISNDKMNKRSKMCTLDQKLIMLPRHLKSLQIDHCSWDYFYTIIKSNFTICTLEIEFELNDPDDLFYLDKRNVNCKIETLIFYNDKNTVINCVKLLSLEHIVHIRKHICKNFFYTKALCQDNVNQLSTTAVELYEFIREHEMGINGQFNASLTDALQHLIQLDYVLKMEYFDDQFMYKVNPIHIHDFTYDDGEY